MRYNELKAKHQKELNDFEGIFFAFDDKQFNRGMEKIGLKPEETQKLYKLGLGGFIRKDRNDAFSEIFDRHKSEMDEAKKSDEFVFDALVYELCNHEYCITYDVEPTLDALGMTIDEINPEVLKRATRQALADSEA